MLLCAKIVLRNSKFSEKGGKEGGWAKMKEALLSTNWAVSIVLLNRTPINFLLLNLAVADMMVALFIAPRFILSHFFKHPDGRKGTLFCKLLTGGNLTWTGGAASVFTLVAIAFERYYAVMYPYGNKGKLTFNKLKVFICIVLINQQLTKMTNGPAANKNDKRVYCCMYTMKT